MRSLFEIINHAISVNVYVYNKYICKIVYTCKDTVRLSDNF